MNSERRLQLAKEWMNSDHYLRLAKEKIEMLNKKVEEVEEVEDVEDVEEVEDVEDVEEVEEVVLASEDDEDDEDVEDVEDVEEVEDVLASEEVEVISEEVVLASEEVEVISEEVVLASEKVEVISEVVVLASEEVEDEEMYLASGEEEVNQQEEINLYTVNERQRLDFEEKEQREYEERYANKLLKGHRILTEEEIEKNKESYQKVKSVDREMAELQEKGDLNRYNENIGYHEIIKNMTENERELYLKKKNSDNEKSYKEQSAIDEKESKEESNRIDEMRKLATTEEMKLAAKEASKKYCEKLQAKAREATIVCDMVFTGLSREEVIKLIDYDTKKIKAKQARCKNQQMKQKMKAGKSTIRF